MDENYRKKLKKELGSVRNKKLELSDRRENLKFRKNPYLFLDYIGNPQSIFGRRDVKDQIKNELYSLDKKHFDLGEQYRDTLRELSDYDLIEKQENLGARIDDLEKRYQRVESFKKDSLFFKLSSENRAANNLLKKINHEREMRKEFLNYTLEEVWSRGICLDVYYTQRISEILAN